MTDPSPSAREPRAARSPAGAARSTVPGRRFILDGSRLARDRLQSALDLLKSAFGGLRLAFDGLRLAFGGLRLALSWLTVLPVRGPQRIDRPVAGHAMVATPLVGLLLGAAMTGVALAGWWAGLGALVAGVIAVAAHALLTRGMHIDGLADTADGLGSYGPPERARRIMLGGDCGPFGAAAIGTVLLIDAAAIGRALEVDRWAAIPLAAVTARLCVVLICAAPFPAASPDGFGALVAGSVGRLRALGWALVVLVAATVAIDGRWWQGPVAVLVTLVIVLPVARHAVRRTGGLSGDILGASIEVGFALTLIGLLVAP